MWVAKDHLNIHQKHKKIDNLDLLLPQKLQVLVPAILDYFIIFLPKGKN
jgi:hypothetical protein